MDGSRRRRAADKVAVVDMKKNSLNTRTVDPPKMPKFTLGLPDKAVPQGTSKTRRARTKEGLVKVRVWGSGRDFSDANPRQKQPSTPVRIRNPWRPDDIVQLLKFVALSYPVSKAFVDVVKAWIQSRGAEEITIEAQGRKLPIKGHMSQSRIEKILDDFAKRMDGSAPDDIKVSLPKGVKRSIPRELTTTRKESKK